jgi:hypothetical protein
LGVRYVVLLRYGLCGLVAVLKVERSHDGRISCWETVHPFIGMTWWMDGRFAWTTDVGREQYSHRVPLPSVRKPQIAYTIPGPRLLAAGFPAYASDIDQGATVQISAHAVVEEPQRVALQLVLVPRGDQPYHRETVGDRRIDDGDPDIWVVLDRRSDGPPDGVAVAQRVRHWPPPLGAQAHPSERPFDS